MVGMTQNEHQKLVRLYLGVTMGYLGGFPDIGELERFYIGSGLDVNPRNLQGTNRARFEQILSTASPSEQAVIIRNALKKCPPNERDWKTRTKQLRDELLAVADRLQGTNTVPSRKPVITSAVVERAIEDAERLLETADATSAIDRLHTMLHGYLRAVCDDAEISYSEKALMSQLFALIRNQQPAFADLGPRKGDVLQILRSMSAIMDAMNPIRNEGSMAHPNKNLLEPPKAAIISNMARTILHYVDMKVSAVTA